MQTCCVPGCKRALGGHRFPNDKKLKKQWLEKIRRPDYKPLRSAVVCRKHFSKDDFIPPSWVSRQLGIDKNRLKKDAVPSTFPWSAEAAELEKTSRSGTSAEHQQETSEMSGAAPPEAHVPASPAIPKKIQMQEKRKEKDERSMSKLSIPRFHRVVFVSQCSQTRESDAEPEVLLQTASVPDVCAYEECVAEEADCGQDSGADDANSISGDSGAGSDSEMVACGAMDVGGGDVSRNGESVKRGVTTFFDATTRQGLRKVPGLSGMKVETFQLLLAILRPEYMKRNGQKQLSVGDLCFENSVLMTVAKLRHALTDELLGVFFAISASTASEIFKQMTALMSHVFQQMGIWSDHYDQAKPAVIVDCVDVEISRQADSDSELEEACFADVWSPSDFELDEAPFPPERSKKVKFLIGVTPSGRLSFASEAHPESVSDEELFTESGILDKLSVGDSVLLVRDFDVGDLLLRNGVRVITSAPRSGKAQLNRTKRSRARAVTRNCARVERMIGLLRAYTFLEREVDAAYEPVLNDIFRSVCLLCGLKKSLMQAT